MLLSLAMLRAIEPVHVGWILPSCGAVTGLPCLFCGFTRAMHFLLNGNVERAIYFNWLVFPVAAAMLAVTAVLLIEILRDVRIMTFAFHVTRFRLAVATVTLVALWTCNAWLAVSQQKTELLNERGPLYAVFVR